MARPTIVTMPGDGIGNQVLPEAIRVLEAVGFEADYVHADIGWECWCNDCLLYTSGVPLGIGSGIYLSEFGRNRFGDSVRFVADVLNGVPSIVIGIAVYSLVVVPQKHFSAFSGAVALGIMMIPTIARTTEEMLLMVPQSIREAAYGLGISQWRTTISICLLYTSRCV